MKEKLNHDFPQTGVFSYGKNKGYLQLPENYNSDKKYPFILFFHGSGASAEDNNFNSEDFAEFRKLCFERGFIVAVPAYGSKSWFNEEAEKIALDMIAFLDKRLSIDQDRFYAMGCSMGGGSALVFTGRHPEMIKGVCDIFGVTDITKYYNEGFYIEALSNAYNGTPEQNPRYYIERSAINYIDVLKQKPVLVIHGDCDSIVPKCNSDEIVAALKKHDADVTYLVVNGMTHSNAIITGLESKVLDFFKNR
jgi:dipeptidyl aminopeptidase/acylaminoacyl peptidase